MSSRSISLLIDVSEEEEEGEDIDLGVDLHGRRVLGFRRVTGLRSDVSNAGKSEKTSI